MIKAVLKEILARCLYVHYDGARYAFKSTPNINKLLEDEVDNISDTEIKNEIKSLLESELGGKSAIIWPNQSRDIPDKEPTFQIAYLPFDFVYKTQSEQEKLGIEFLTQYGDRPRSYRNGIGLAIPDKDQIEPLRRSAKYLIAIERLKNKKRSLNLTEEQIEQLKEREKTEIASRDSALRGLYNKVWLLKIENGNPIIDAVEIGGRAIQSTNIHDRLMNLLMRTTTPKVFDSLTPKKLLDYIKDETIGVETIIEIFFSSLDSPKVVSKNVIIEAISKGIKDGLFGLTTKDYIQGVRDVSLIPQKNVIIRQEVPIDEIDVESSYIVSSKKIKTIDEKSDITIPLSSQTISSPIEKEKEAHISYCASESKITNVSYELKLTRAQLYKCFKAFENLFEKSKKISLKLEANFSEGVDHNWIRNAFEEPLEENGVDIVNKDYK
ncbi:MAG: hypothetical protein N2254_04940 [bacterium]|nr:hypothetical protein [bacterium]